MLQRRISKVEAYYIIDHGLICQKSGAVWYVLRNCDVPPEDHCRKDVARLVDLVVCVENGVVSTIFRNPEPLRYIARKAPHYRPWQKPRVEYLWEVVGKAA